MTSPRRGSVRGYGAARPSSPVDLASHDARGSPPRGASVYTAWLRSKSSQQSPSYALVLIWKNRGSVVSSGDFDMYWRNRNCVDLVRTAFPKRLLGLVHGRHVAVVAPFFWVHPLVLWDVLQRIRGYEIVGIDETQRVSQLHGCDKFDLQDFPKCGRIDLRLVLDHLPEQHPQPASG